MMPSPVELPAEKHLRNVRQLTFGGENAEAYFSADGTRLIFQSTRDGRACDQQYVMNVDGTGLARVSNGEGKTTCGYFYADDRRVFFASTHAADSVWPTVHRRETTSVFWRNRPNGTRSTPAARSALTSTRATRASSSRNGKT